MSDNEEPTCEEHTDEQNAGDGDKKGNSSKKHQETKQKPAVVVDAYFTTFELSVQQSTTGLQLFEQIASLLNLREVWLFGIQFRDSKGVLTWLKLKKNIFDHNVGKKRPIQMSFRGKFYPEDIEKELEHPVARRLFYEQVKEAILSSRLYCPVDTAVLLASYALQEMYGHYNAVLQPTGFLAEEKMIPKKLTSQYEVSSQEWEDKMVAFYKDHRNLTKEQAILEYLKIAQDLEMFGVDYFSIKNKKGTDLYLGLDALGLNVYEKDNKLAPKLGFPWHEIKILSFKDKKFTITPVDDKTPDFVFTVSKTYMNKEILTLSMGNHELYIRRRKVDVAPGERSSLSRKSDNIVEDMKRKKRSYRVSEMSKDIPIIVPGTSQGNTYEEFAKDDQVNDTTLPNERLKTHKASDVSEITTSGPYEQIDDTPDTEPKERIAERNRSARENVYQHISSVYQEQEETMLQKHEQESCEGQVQFSDAYEEDEEEQQVLYNHTEERDLDTLPEYAAVLPRRKSIAKEDSIPERRRYIPRNPETYTRIQGLFEEMSAAQTEWSKEHSYYQQMMAEGMDKYKTLKNIRSGFARDRIALFESI